MTASALGGQAASEKRGGDESDDRSERAQRLVRAAAPADPRSGAPGDRRGAPASRHEAPFGGRACGAVGRQRRTSQAGTCGSGSRGLPRQRAAGGNFRPPAQVRGEAFDPLQLHRGPRRARGQAGARHALLGEGAGAAGGRRRPGSAGPQAPAHTAPRLPRRHPGGAVVCVLGPGPVPRYREAAVGQRLPLPDIGRRLRRRARPADSVIEAVHAADEEAAPLGVGTGAMVLRVDSVTYDRADTAVEFSRVLYRVERFRFSLESYRFADRILHFPSQRTRKGVRQ